MEGWVVLPAPHSPAPKTQMETNRGTRWTCPGVFSRASGTPPTRGPRLTPSLASPARFQGDSRLEQSGCYHHCVDENIERRNHYLDLAGIENYTSQFGPGKGSSFTWEGGEGQAWLGEQVGQTRMFPVPLSLGKAQLLSAGLQSLLGGDDI